MADASLLIGLIGACRQVIEDHADRLCLLDEAIGDGDHGTNMLRGLRALDRAAGEIAGLELPEAIDRIGRIMLGEIGGAPGPLYGTLFIELAKRLSASEGLEHQAEAFGHAVEAVARRGRTRAGDKTLFDVLVAIEAEWRARAGAARIAETALAAARATAPMIARRGRASWLGERSVGHVDPGAESCALMTQAICDRIAGGRP